MQLNYTNHHQQLLHVLYFEDVIYYRDDVAEPKLSYTEADLFDPTVDDSSPFSVII